MKCWQQKWTLGITAQGGRVRCRTLSPSHSSLSTHTAWQRASSGPSPISSGCIYLGGNFCVSLEKAVDRNFFAPTTDGVTPSPVKPGGRSIVLYKIYSLIQEQFLFLAFLLHSGFHLQQNKWLFPVYNWRRRKGEIEDHPGYKRKYLVKEIYRCCLQHCSCKHSSRYCPEWRRGGAT